MIPITLIQFFTLLLLMLVTGVFWGPWFALHRSMKVFNAGEFIKIVRVLSANLAFPMRIMMPSCILFMILSVWCYPQADSLGFYLCLIAVLLIVLALIVTIVVEVPIVKQIEQWTEETVPADMEEIQNKWLKFHVIRTFSAIIAFACYTTSVLLS